LLIYSQMWCKDHVWSYDFVHERTKDKRSFRILTAIDEFTRENLGKVVRRKFTSLDVIEALSQLFITRGLPKHICSNNGPEFASIATRLVHKRTVITNRSVEELKTLAFCESYLGGDRTSEITLSFSAFSGGGARRAYHGELYNLCYNFWI
jgi:hypothetical protein